MSLVTEQHVFLQDFANLILFAIDSGYQVTAGELLRTQEQQAIYLKQKKSKTMDSLHLKKLAGDLSFFKKGIWLNGQKDAIEQIRPLGEYWKSLSPNNVWGGDWGWDVDHFERRI